MTDISAPAVERPQTANRLEHFPVPFFAVVMGVAGLTLALHAVEAQAALPHLASHIALAVTCALFCVLALIYGLKALRHPAAVRAEWQHPVKLAFFPAMSISILLIATAMRPALPDLARVIWALGALAQAGLTLAVLSAWIGQRAFQPGHLSPAWFIPAVGNIVAPVAGVALGFTETSWVFFAAGLIFWIVLLALVMQRLIFHDPMPGKMVPTLAILMAPPAVGFLAWLQLNGDTLDAFARILYGTALLFAGLAAPQIVKLRGQPFALSWWALSFPVAALTIATLRFGTLAASQGHVFAAYAGLALLIGIVTALILRTLLAIAHRQICHPE